MSRDDVEGAEAAAEYFLELYQYAYTTGDLDAWEQMSHPDCVFCGDVSADVGDLFAGGGHSEGGDFTVTAASGFDPLDGNDYFRVDLEAVEEPSVRVEGSGAQDSTLGGESLLIFALEPNSGGWLVREVMVEGVDSRG